MPLQRTIGNRAVGKLLSEIGLTPSRVKQTQPVQIQSIHEEGEETLQSKTNGTLQLKEPEEEDKIQMKSVLQRQDKLEEEETLQGKFEKSEQEACPSCSTHHLIQKQEENLTGIPDNLKAGVESLSRIDLSDARVHYNSSKPAELGALAYTQGTNIHIAPGQESHLPHEAWHVVQQKQGRVKSTMQMRGLEINDDMGLEREADDMGHKAVLQMHSRSLKKELYKKTANSDLIQKSMIQSGIIQKVCIENPDAKEDAKIFFNLRYNDNNGDETSGAHNYAFINEDHENYNAKSDSSSHAEIKLLALYPQGQDIYIVSELKPCGPCQEFIEKYEQTHNVTVTIYHNLDYEDTRNGNIEAILNMYRGYKWLSSDSRYTTTVLKAGKRVLGIID